MCSSLSSSACYVFLSVRVLEGKHVFLIENEKMSDVIENEKMSDVRQSLLKFCFTHGDGLRVPPRKLHEVEILYPSQTMMMRQRASPGTRSNEARTCQRIMASS